MVALSRGEIWWADLPEPTGSGPGFRRPVVVVQSDALSRSRIGTAVCIPLTSNQAWAEAPGGVFLSKRATGLPKDSVANATLVTAVDRRALVERTGRLTPSRLAELLAALDVVLGR